VEGLVFNLTGDVSVSFRIRWTPGQRMLSGLLVQVVGSEQPVELRPAEVAVALSGPQVALDRLDPAKIVPQIEVSEEMVSSGEVQSLEVTVKGLPSDIEVKSVAPASVMVKFASQGGKPKKHGGQVK